MSGRAWTEKDDAFLLALLGTKLPRDQIAIALERPSSSISSRAKLLAERHGSTVAPTTRPPQPSRWSTEEDATLARMKAAGATPVAMAKKLDRAESSVYRRLETLEDRSQRRERPCMCCRHPFMSDGPHNRLCTRCRNKETSPYQP